MNASFSTPSEPQHVVVIVGGAVAGSEAAALCAERGILAIVLEQNPRPFGKIEDGLPRWHQKLRDKEYAQIAVNLTKPGVLFVPRTQLGRDVTIEEIRDQWGVNAVLLASGAWRDRPLFKDADAHVGRGLVYQNPFVYWYNHYPEQSYAGTRYEVPDGAIVVGGGLASIDVVKIINFELYKRALKVRGIHVTTLELEHAGIPQTLAAHKLTQEELGVKGVTLYYRREKTAMPLASPPDNATPAQLEKTGQVRAKVMDKVIEKYLVKFEPNHAPVAAIVEDGRMVGVRFQRTQTVDGKLVNVENGLIDVRSALTVSSIGSIPLATPGLPMKGELIDFESWDSGKVRGFDNVFGLGNVLTGKGNIKESRKNSQEVTEQFLSAYLGVGGELSMSGAHESARAAAQEAVKVAESRPKLLPGQISQLFSRIQQHWQRVDYAGDYPAYLARVSEPCEET
jgi:ferredoxin--NADP+ reductase